MNYTVECQSTPSTSQQILAACTHIIESLRVPSSSSAGWHVLSSWDDAVHVSVPSVWSEESTHPASVNLAAKLKPPSSPTNVVSLWITLIPASLFTQSYSPNAMVDGFFQLRLPGMQLTNKRSVRLPIGMARRVTLEDESGCVIGYVIIKGHTVAIVSFSFEREFMPLVRPTIDAVVRTLTLD